MTRRTRGLIIGVFCIVAIRTGHSQTPPPELWYWHHSYLTNPSALQSSMALIDQAHAAGYTGVAFWDVSFEFLNSPTWPPSATSYLQQAMNYAISKGMKVIADGAPYGWSNDVLQTNPNWAEGQRISGARFQVNGSATQLQLVNSFPGLVNGGFESGKTAWFRIGDAGVDVDSTVSHSGGFSGVIRNAPANGRFAQLLPLTPWRQYHLRMFVKTQNYAGSTPWFMVWDVSSSAKQRLYNNINIASTQDWKQVDATFNSQDSTQAWLYFGEWGGSTGAIWFDDVSVEETALVNVLRRPGTPLKIYDPNTTAAFQEGKDYNFVSDPQLGPYPKDDYHTPPAVTLPAGTTLTPGQTVAMDFYAVQPIYSNETGMCLTEAGVQNWLTQNAQAVTAAVPASAGYFLGYDEMRHMNSCASCKAKGFTPGQLLAWHAGQTIGLYQSLRPSAPIYVWSDMFDPYHNAHDNYYLVEGDIAGSWLGLPSSVTIMNWNLGDLKNSLTWFSGQNSQQPVAHRQIIAGYYDSGNGAGAAATELQQALGIPGVVGLMYTTWLDDYSQLKPFADAVRNNWASYQASHPSLNIIQNHTGSFTQGQQNAVYTATVSNAANAGSSSGTVTVTETTPAGLTFVSMSGPGWACSGNTCTRSDVLNPVGSYPPITVSVNVAANAASPQVNMVSVSGGGSATANAMDSTTILSALSTLLQQTWVSGAGDDANACDRATPCKTFAGAIAKTASGGEIDCLDPGEFGTLTITKAITINCGGGNGGFSGGTNGIVVQAPSNANVTLRNLDIQDTGGQGVSGIQFLSGAYLHIQGVQIHGFSQNGIDVNNPAFALATVRNSVIGDIGMAGVNVVAGAVSVDNIQISNAATGVHAGTNAKVMLTRTTIMGTQAGTSIGVNADTGGAAVTIDSTLIAFCNVGVSASGGGNVFLGNSSINNNVTGVSGNVSNSSPLTNTFFNNISNGVFGGGAVNLK